MQLGSFMLNQVHLPEEKKLMVIVRVEPGCLGPDGAEHVEGFCVQAAPELSQIDRHFTSWKIVPRNDRSLPEFEYQVNSKILSSDKTDRYLSMFDRTLEEFENDLNSYLVTMIEDYLDHH